ncbi:MAG: prolyl oligopeptidase family serine peptidase [Mariniblastus sp.]|nr:prolyl oligopeptidase family serine peptidase [Mariniblastus sp.]
MVFSLRTGPAFLLALVCLATPTVSTLADERDDARSLEHSDYDRWNTINASALSHDGNWVMYSVRDGKDNVTLKFRQTASSREFSIANGTGARFTDDSQFAIFRVTPDKALIEKLKKEKKKPEEMPKSQLTVLHLESGRTTTIDNVTTFKIPRDNSEWAAFLLGSGKNEATLKTDKSSVNETLAVTPQGLQRPRPGSAKAKKAKRPAAKNPSSKLAGKSSSETAKQPKQESSKTEPQAKAAGNDKEKKKEKKAGSELVLYNLKTGVEQRFPNVVSFEFSKPGNLLVFSTSTKERPAEDGAWVMDLNRGTVLQVAAGLGDYRGLAINDKGNEFAFLTNRDDYSAKQPAWSLYHWRTGQKEAKPIATSESPSIVANWGISSNGSPMFSEDGRRLYFNTAPLPTAEEDENDEPQAKLDLWHWQDPQLQPQQLLRAEQERNRSYRAVYDLKAKKITQLATPQIPQVAVDPRSKANQVVGTSQEKYRKLMSWDIPGYQDTYLIDLKSGEAKPVLEKARSGGKLSPAGKFITWWDTDQRAWFAVPTAKQKDDNKPVQISAGIKHALYNVLHDTPSDPRPYGMAGWLDDDQAVLVYDRYDIWQLDPTGQQPPICLTKGEGRAASKRYRYVQLDPLQRSIDPQQPMILSMFDEGSKASGYTKRTPAPAEELTQLLALEESVGGLKKAKDSDAVIMTRSTFRRSPDLWYSHLGMKSISRISRINPQQMEYRWGTAELVHWDSADGGPLDGILYKPDGFDPSKKYPMLVYFYERSSDKLHSYYAPAAGRSIINFSFYVSRGYLLFVPDIPYKTGFPGKSAADAILPGVTSLVKQGFVDEDRIGMQGHSWGGYQTAFLVTQTDMFACAESGAPVSNMTSAYGGIRWSSGMSRMFQYERTQSRIGATLWEDREKYILNSPLFQADKINTPLLILHNDEDGAVPWYQGIELFVALRRLEKPAWLLNYNQQPHWVMKEENRRDFARRMQQFFDHYLMDAPMPVWMAKGIPAVDKGKEFGFESSEPEKIATEGLPAALEKEPKGPAGK